MSLISKGARIASPLPRWSRGTDEDNQREGMTMRAIDIDDAVLEASRIYREQAKKADAKIKGERKGEAFNG